MDGAWRALQDLPWTPWAEGSPGIRLLVFQIFGWSLGPEASGTSGIDPPRPGCRERGLALPGGHRRLRVTGGASPDQRLQDQASEVGLHPVVLGFR